MNVRSTIAVAALSVVSTLSAQTIDKPAEGKADAPAKAEDKAVAPTTVPMDKISYLMGREIASMQNGQLGQQGLKIDAESFAQGAKDGIAGVKLKYIEAELETAYKAFQAHMAGAEAKRANLTAGGARRSGLRPRRACCWARPRRRRPAPRSWSVRRRSRRWPA